MILPKWVIFHSRAFQGQEKGDFQPKIIQSREKLKSTWTQTNAEYNWIKILWNAENKVKRVPWYITWAVDYLRLPKLFFIHQLCFSVNVGDILTVVNQITQIYFFVPALYKWFADMDKRT